MFLLGTRPLAYTVKLSAYSWCIFKWKVKVSKAEEQIKRFAIDKVLAVLPAVIFKIIR